MVSKRIIVMAPSLDVVHREYVLLLRALKQAGHLVLCLTFETSAPPQSHGAGEALDNDLIDHVHIDKQPARWPLLSNPYDVTTIATIFQSWRPQIILNVGYLAAFFSAAAVRKMDVERVVTICDDLPDFLRARVKDAHEVSRRQLRKALGASDVLVFYNQQHVTTMRDTDLIAREATPIIVKGLGADLDQDGALPLPDLQNGLVFLMAGPADAESGLLDYMQAARRLAPKAPSTRFHLLTWPGTDDIAAPLAEFAGSRQLCLPPDTSLREALSMAHVFVYPGHGGGMPKPIIDALAAGRAIITTDMPGLRDTVDETVNGYLVPRGNVVALTDAMSAILKRPDLLPAMARGSRKKAERLFDQRFANTALFEALGLGQTTPIENNFAKSASA